MLNRRTFTLTASANRPIAVAVPHGAIELHPTGSLLSRHEYYELTRAVGLVEARAVISHHGLEVGAEPARHADVRSLDADVARFVVELAA
jgi:hypothetical protein